MQWWFKKFRKGDEKLEGEEHSGQPLEVDNDQLRAIIEVDPLTTTLENAKNSVSTILWSFGIWSKLERQKSSISGCLMSWPKIKGKKRMLFWSVVFSYSMQHQWTISPSDCERDKKWILYNWQWPAQWLDWEESPKHFPKPNLHQKKVIVTVWWSPAHMIHFNFLNPSETITSQKYVQ